MFELSNKTIKKLLFFCLVLFNFLLFLITFVYIERKLYMSQNVLNNFIFPIFASIISAIITSVIVYIIFQYFSKKEKWRRLSNKINKKYPGYKNIDKYYKKNFNMNILETGNGEIPIIDLFYIADFYITSIQRYGSVDEKDNIYNFMYSFLKLTLLRINKLKKRNIVINSGGKEEFTDVLLDIKMPEMFGQKIDRKAYLENYRNYLLDLTFYEITNNFYSSLIIYNKKAEKIEFLRLKRKEFNRLIKNI